MKITNTGTVAVAITQDTIAGAGFSVGITTPINLNPRAKRKCSGRIQSRRGGSREWQPGSDE